MTARSLARRLIERRLGDPRDRTRLAADVCAELSRRRAQGTPSTEPLLVPDDHEAIRWIALGRRGADVARLIGISAT